MVRARKPEVFCEIFSPRNGSINKTETRARSIDMPKLKLHGVTPLHRNLEATSDCWEEKISLSQA